MALWNPAQYLKFEDERTRPPRDLLAQVPLAAPARVVDLGCGPGNSTELLVERFPEAEVIGLDTSPQMLESARKRLPNVRFELADAATLTFPEPVDLIFANAVLQWVPDHATVFPRLLSLLAPGGVLAVQMPDNLNAPSHAAMRAAAAAGPWAEKLTAAAGQRTAMPSPGTYYDLLAPEAARVDIWHTIYNHPLDGTDAIIEWVKGTGLRPYIDPLDEDERAGFLKAYRALLVEPYPVRVDGKVLLPFPRLFIVAVRR